MLSKWNWIETLLLRWVSLADSVTAKVVGFDPVAVSAVNYLFSWCFGVHSLILLNVKMQPDSWSALLKHWVCVTPSAWSTNQFVVCYVHHKLYREILFGSCKHLFVHEDWLQPCRMGVPFPLSAMERRNCNKPCWSVCLKTHHPW